MRSIYNELIKDVGNGFEYMEYDPRPYGYWEVGMTVDHEHVIIYGTNGEYGFTCAMDTLVFVNMEYEELEKYINAQIYYNAVEL